MPLWLPVPSPSYSQARENLVKSLPPNLICSLSCGGKLCRYEGPANWSLQQQAIRGLYSEWVTDDIVAMARPSTTLIKEYNIIEQFTKLNIKSIINMQVQGEHAHCGPPLEQESGFSYVPQIFMENGIYFFNFGMPDFGVSSLIRILDGVKVLTFALKEGKVAVHCHAGLGRTGVLVACYLIYATRVSPSEAIHFVRIKRPSSIQTQPQIDLVFDFARFLAPHLIMYANVDAKTYPFTLEQYLIRQKHLLHGYEARNLKHIPKIVDFTCKRLIMIALNKADCRALQTEVERESFMHDLTHLIRQTLVRQTFLHITTLLNDPDNRLTPSVSSATSWGEKEGFKKRKREVLQNKRSYSESDLSKISVLEKNKEQGSPGLGTVSLSQAVAIAMAELEPIGNDLLKEIQQWQYQGETICCILDCISQLTSLSPKMEEAIICRLIRALTQCPEEEVKTFTGLLELFKTIIQEKRTHNLFTKGLVKTKHMLKMSSVMKNKQKLF
ncbi:UNVERIFIED_CONTAM: hypothetical protein FKN15_035258 [Acipenser sinensis]